MSSLLPPHIAYTRSINTDIWCNLSNSCAKSMSLQQLLQFEGAQALFDEFTAQPLAYASIQGDKRLRDKILAYHQHRNSWLAEFTADNIITFSGAQEALRAIYQSLLNADDEVIVFTPNYPSLASMVDEFGAKLVALPLHFENGWQIDLDKLASAITDKTKLIVINIPHNPTGAILSSQQRRKVLALAKKANCYLLSDDVSQGISLSNDNLGHEYFSYEKAIAVSVLSKSFGLGGVRIGWAISKNLTLIERLVAIKSQASICTGITDETLARIALRHYRLIEEENKQQVIENIKHFQNFTDKHAMLFRWHPPQAGLLTLVEYLGKQPIEAWARAFTEKTGVLILPSSLFGLAGNYFRLGLGQSNFSDGLNVLENFIQEFE